MQSLQANNGTKNTTDPCDSLRAMPHRRRRDAASSVSLAPSGSNPRNVPPDDVFFVVATLDYSERCGGCQVLHRLCDQLNVIYADVRDTPLCYLANLRQMNVNAGYKTPLLPPWLSPNEGIVIYPEIVTGNPLRAKRVINWILYFPETHGGPPTSQFSRENLIACFSSSFCAGFDDAEFKKVPLRLHDYGFEYFLNAAPPGTNKSGALTCRRKDSFNSPRLGKIQVSENFSVPENPISDGGKRSRVEQFARAESFHSMDPVTFLSVEAAMAGTLSVVVPVPGVDKEEWMDAVGDERQFGVAYGDDDIPRARASLPCVLPHLRNLASQERDGLAEFVQQAISYFASREEKNLTTTSGPPR